MSIGTALMIAGGGLGLGGTLASAAGQRQGLRASRRAIGQQEQRQARYDEELAALTEQLLGRPVVDLAQPLADHQASVALATPDVSLPAAGSAGAFAGRRASGRVRSRARTQGNRQAFLQALAAALRSGDSELADIHQQASLIRQLAGESAIPLDAEMAAAGAQGGELRALGAAAGTLGPSLFQRGYVQRQDGRQQLLQILRRANAQPGAQLLGRGVPGRPMAGSERF